MDCYPAASAAASTRRHEADERSIHVLIVQRDPRMLRTMLEEAEKPLDVHFRTTCIDGMESYPNHASPDMFDVILLDLETPGEDAFQAVYRARFFAPGVPVVVLADAEQKQQVPHGVRQEMDDILVRDQLTGVLLANSLHHVCERGRLQHALGSLPRDCRTGMFNRHFFSVMAEQYLRLAVRLDGVVVFYGTMDGLHRINPPLSYLEERRLVLSVARLLGKCFRGSDLIAHWGRLEFAALAIGARAEHIPALQMRLKRTLDAFNMVTEPRQRIHLSHGFIAHEGDAERSVGELISAADAARRRPPFDPKKTA